VIVLAAGGYRSGSTLQYNLIGGYVEHARIGRRAAFVNPGEAHSFAAGVVSTPDLVAVAKCPHVVAGFHDFEGRDAAWAEIVGRGHAVPIVTRRNVADIERSMCRKFGYPTVDELRASPEWEEDRLNAARWQELGAFEQCYDDLVERPVTSLHSLVRQLGLRWNRWAALRSSWDARRSRTLRQIRGLQPGSWDPITLVHDDHIDPGRVAPRTDAPTTRMIRERAGNLADGGKPEEA
jgi:hypothetical protein